MLKKIVFLIVAAAIATTTMLQGADASANLSSGEFDSSQVRRVQRNPIMERIERQARTPRVTTENRLKIETTHDDQNAASPSTGNSLCTDALEVIGNSAFYIARNRLLVMMTELAINNMTPNAPNAALLAHGFILVSDVIYNQGIRGNIRQTLADLYNHKNISASLINIAKNASIACLKGFVSLKFYEIDNTAVYQIAYATREASRGWGGIAAIGGGEIARHSVTIGRSLWDSSKDYVYKGAATLLAGSFAAITEVYAKPKEHWSMVTRAFSNTVQTVQSTASAFTQKVKSWIFG